MISVPVRRSELMAAISLATDLGMAQPLESGLATCLATTVLAARLGLEPAHRQRAYHLSLLQHIGCTAASAQIADVVGDEMVSAPPCEPMETPPPPLNHSLVVVVVTQLVQVP